MRNVTFTDIQMDTPIKAIYVKTNPADSGFASKGIDAPGGGGTIEDILY